MTGGAHDRAAAARKGRREADLRSLEPQHAQAANDLMAMRTARGEFKRVDRTTFPLRRDRLARCLEAVNLLVLGLYGHEADRTFRGAGGQPLSACRARVHSGRL